MGMDRGNADEINTASTYIGFNFDTIYIYNSDKITYICTCFATRQKDKDAEQSSRRPFG